LLSHEFDYLMDHEYEPLIFIESGVEMHVLPFYYFTFPFIMQKVFIFFVLAQ